MQLYQSTTLQPWVCLNRKKHLMCYHCLLLGSNRTRMFCLLHHLQWKIVVANNHPLTMNPPLMLGKHHVRHPQWKQLMTLLLTTRNHQANQFLLEIKQHIVTRLFLLLPRCLSQLWVNVTQFVLKDGYQLHFVKVVGAFVFYHEYWNNFTIEIEDGTGLIQVAIRILTARNCNFALELHR